MLTPEYTYNAWGEIISITGTEAETIGQKNPLRYRGYYYDEETGFYYLNIRYYDAEIGRFVSADIAISGTGESVQGYNLFSYCFNNPVNMNDPTGGWPKWISKVTNSIKKAIKKVANNVKKACNTVKNNCGIAINIDNEQPTDTIQRNYNTRNRCWLQ